MVINRWKIADGRLQMEDCRWKIADGRGRYEQLFIISVHKVFISVQGKACRTIPSLLSLVYQMRDKRLLLQ